MLAAGPWVVCVIGVFDGVRDAEGLGLGSVSALLVHPVISIIPAKAIPNSNPVFFKVDRLLAPIVPVGRRSITATSFHRANCICIVF